MLCTQEFAYSWTTEGPGQSPRDLTPGAGLPYCCVPYALSELLVGENWDSWGQGPKLLSCRAFGGLGMDRPDDFRRHGTFRIDLEPTHLRETARNGFGQHARELSSLLSRWRLSALAVRRK